MNTKVVNDIHITNMKHSTIPKECLTTSKNNIQSSLQNYTNLQPPAITSGHKWGNNATNKSSTIKLYKK